MSSGLLVDEAKPIHVLDTSRSFLCHFIWITSNIENAEQLDYSKPNSNDVNPSEKIAQLARKSSAGPLAQGQPQERTPSMSDAYATHGAPSFQKATPEELGYPASPQITHEQNPSSNDLPSQPSGVNDKPIDITEEDDDSEGSTGHHAKLVNPVGAWASR